ncbi:hypothetical protein K7X08_003646 [Anisodus acutangulus]|uniref:Uncharacterized protein n=1 Tax=Anisodus acutangulus TaxID=402998 RepID=A0A9Q1RGQ0_9SOLA|nr:hypothetical protein K7X08_003646 [Anisodus acutangulus]
MEEINLNGTTNGGNSNSDDEVVVGEQDELASSIAFNGFGGANSANGGDFNQQKEKAGVSGEGGFFHFETSDNDDPFGDRPIPGMAQLVDPQKAATLPSLFEEDVEFVGVELEGTEKAMEHALKEGIVWEEAPLKRSLVPKMPEKDSTEEGGSGVKEFNDANNWRVDQEVAVLE